MNTKQKISLLFSDYALRVIQARIVPELADLAPIRSIEDSRDAGFTIKIPTQRANAADAQYATWRAYLGIHNAVYSASIKALKLNLLAFRVMRQMP